MPDFTGQTIDAGRYLLDKPLGSGAYGKVYRAMDLKSSSERPKFYAVKCMPIYDPKSSKAEFQRRELLNHPVVCEHPNVVHYQCHFRDAHWIYVVMELVSGGDLFAAITEKHVFRNNDALVKKIYIQIIDALQFCHGRGIFHRDIKPENILCSEDGRQVKLADFGLSTRNGASSEYGCGSCYYMSPECIAEGQPRLKYSSKQTDVWSMGVILVNMISGRNPWRYATVDDSCFQAYLLDNNFLFKVLPISAEANAIIKRIFTIDPLRRITLHQLREEITRVGTFFRTHQAPAKITRINHSIEYVESGWQTESDPLPAHQRSFISSEGAVLFTSPIILPPDTLSQVITLSIQPGLPGPSKPEQSQKSFDASSSATDSSKSSMAIKTPSVHPVGPVAVAQPGSGDDDIEEPLVLPDTILDKNLRSPGGKAKSISIKNGRNIIRAAVQRIKDFSTPAGHVGG
ncbi:hypothetical protein AGABI1DRAFT_73057 [Agaricus bisporus var. burnettii JB137-S8]|uniref:Protein kinase domain-containing protein n=1 Tax=Agaricus bisporus var. burnettii (strain JB137-S8 / ATCC MYA-4627 / FGSC 10392) TaxID=597362 RepID=K5WXE6_AGABU|nr:uncharacterized protein AGABI1DRAFT_73057 [Agaricus bisporus var. burnettii JB137-S8]EKM80146.1 hypothetical protein AGABI1DRAFT_73057 [Agaricus bisporus var. burnettii JB137-S8]